MSNVKIKANASGTADFTIQAPATDSAVTMTLPADAGTILTDASDVPAANLTGSLPAGMGGKVLQVVQDTKTDTYSAGVSSGGESGDVTGLSCSITPSSTSSKVLVTFSVNVGAPTDQYCAVAAYVNGSKFAVGDSSGSRHTTTMSSREIRNNDMVTLSMTYLHSPSSTSTQTYTVRLWHGSGGTQTIMVNRSYNDADASYCGRGISTITAVEIAG